MKDMRVTRQKDGTEVSWRGERDKAQNDVPWHSVGESIEDVVDRVAVSEGKRRSGVGGGGPARNVTVYRTSEKKSGCLSILLVLGAILALLSVPVLAAPEEPPWGEKELQQILWNGGFEEGYVPWGWKFRINAKIDIYNPYDGLLHGHIGGPGALGVIEQKLPLQYCEPGPVWMSLAYSDMPSAGPWPEDQFGKDRSTGWIANKDGQMVVLLWDRYDYEAEGMWKFVWYRIENLFDVCVDEECTLKIGAANDDNPLYYVNWDIDNVAFWCEVLHQEHKIFLPIAWR